MQQQKIEQMATKIMEVKPSMPAAQALKKAAATRTGVFSMVIGFVLCVMGFAIPGAHYILLRSEPGITTLLFSGVVFFGGLWFLASGAHAASGEVMETADGFIGGLGKLLQLWKSK
jgi:hypothetical protein